MYIYPDNWESHSIHQHIFHHIFHQKILACNYKFHQKGNWYLQHRSGYTHNHSCNQHLYILCNNNMFQKCSNHYHYIQLDQNMEELEKEISNLTQKVPILNFGYPNFQTFFIIMSLKLWNYQAYNKICNFYLLF